METQSPTGENNLCAAILREAENQADKVTKAAEEQAAGLIAQARAEADRLRGETLTTAGAAAVRRREAVLASVHIEVNRQRSAQVAALTSVVFQQVRQRLVTRTGYDYSLCLVALAAEALVHMPGESFVIRLSPADRAVFGKGLLVEIAQRDPCQMKRLALAEDHDITEGGLVVQDSGGQLFWDNRLPQRLERMWPELRRQIAVWADWTADEAPEVG